MIFAPGDIVECIAPPEGPIVSVWTPVVGCLYTVSEFYPADESIPEDDLSLVEDPVPEDGCFGACFFRKVYRPDPGLIAKLLHERAPIADRVAA